MWDLISYSDEDLALNLRSKQGEFVYSYPWSTPTLVDRERSEGRAEEINVKQDRLFAELTVRARFCAYDRVFRLARSGMNGKIPTSIDQAHTEALKFALKRYEQSHISGEDFITMIRAAAIISPIPSGFWRRLEGSLTEGGLTKLRQSMDALRIFHEMPDELWITEAQQYVSKVLWFANRFDSIQTVCAQMAIAYPHHHLKEALVELGGKARGMIARAHIEAEQMNAKPWQKTTGYKRTLRGSTVGTSSKKNGEESDTSKQ